MKKLLAGIILATLFFAIGIFLVSKKNSIQTTDQPIVKQPSNMQVPTPTIDAPPPIRSREATVLLTSSGFSPKIITLYPGTILTLENKSGKNTTITSTKYPPLNLGEIKNGEQAKIVSDKAGIYPYSAGNNTATLVVVNK